MKSLKEGSVVICQIKHIFYNKAMVVPQDLSQPPILITGRDNLRGSLNDDTVKVDIKSKRVIFDEKTERAISHTHFGSSFLCRVSEFKSSMLYPLDKRFPKIVNLPTITRVEKRGVVCFDPTSINDTPKVCNVIPHEVALRMVFVVKFLGWKKRFPFPLGIIVGAFPTQSPHFQELILKIQHNIPISPPTEIKSEASTGIVSQRTHFPHAITIDPEGSTDHDDALTCTVSVRGSKKIYTVGVHITDLNLYIKKDTELNQQAKKRGCTVYNAPDSICSPMLPASVLKIASIHPGGNVNTFSVLIEFIVSNEGLKSEKVEPGNVLILESSVSSEAELTYSDVQNILFRDKGKYTKRLRDKMQWYNSQSPNVSLKQLIKCLWKFAWCLRKKRLKAAALTFTAHEEDEKNIQKLTIWLKSS